MLRLLFLLPVLLACGGTAANTDPVPAKSYQHLEHVNLDGVTVEVYCDTDRHILIYHSNYSGFSNTAVKDAC